MWNDFHKDPTQVLVHAYHFDSQSMLTSEERARYAKLLAILPFDVVPTALTFESSAEGIIKIHCQCAAI